MVLVDFAVSAFELCLHALLSLSSCCRILFFLVIIVSFNGAHNLFLDLIYVSVWNLGVMMVSLNNSNHVLIFIMWHFILFIKKCGILFIYILLLFF